MTEAYKVGITIALTNQISRGLFLIQGDLAKTDAQAKKLHATLREIKTLGLAGAIFGGIGYAGLHALGKTLDAAKEYQQALAQFKAVGLGDSINSDADKFARGASVIGASATDLIRTTRDLHTALGDYGMAKSLAPQIAQMKFANQAVFGSHGMDFSENQLRAMEKIIEMKGGFKSPQAFMGQADMMQKVISGTGGMVKPSDYLQFIKTAGVAGRLLSNESFYYTMEPLIQEMSGNRVGTATMSAYNNLAQGRATVRAAREMMKLGILNPRMVEYNKIGEVKSIHPGALKGMDQFASDPFRWMQEVFIPAMKAKGITSESAILNEMGSIFGNRTASNLFSLMFLQQDKIEKNMAISKGAMDTQQLFKLAMTTPGGADKALGAAWDNLKTAAGNSLIPIIIPALNKLAEVLRAVGQFVYQHPRVFDTIIYGFAGLSAALLFSGSLLTLKAAFIGIKFLMPTLAAQITGSVLPALTGLTAVLGPLAAIALAIANAEGIGKWADDHGLTKYNPFVMAEKFGERIGNRILADNPGRYGVTPPRGGRGKSVIEVPVNLDGRQIAKIVSDYQYHALNTSQSSGSGFDGRQSFVSPSHNPFAP
ncbi:phage tail tape measure protein [Limnoglobus roseus]|uniref:Phage tail tape measure protein n=1 Tax=Limnoglobus roseus TaxID=2598579 RepID=A0A5C1AKI4_9BACT|nr:hypothetical protein [Limnoglobus roseus]QEL18713.1 hypothetical protein PX52LOC_05749 [Limnoglobus roseus]